MTTTQDSTEDWLNEIVGKVGFKSYQAGKSGKDHELEQTQIMHSRAKAKIRQHMLSEALVLIGEDDNEVRGTTQSPDNPNYWTKRTKHRNELKAELRQAFTEKYGERE